MRCKTAALVSSEAPVGVYDSGVGGLSVLASLRHRLPREQFVYIADSRYAPYGTRTSAFIEKRAMAIATSFSQQHVKAIVLACNTASVIAAGHVRAASQVPVIALEPAIKPAALNSKSGVILVLATTATLKSDAVAKLCARFGEQRHILLQACPLLVELIEAGRANDAATLNVLAGYLRPGMAAGADTIVLGCTHFSFVAPAIAKLAGPDVSILDSTEAVANQLQRVLLSGAGLSARPEGSVTYYTTGTAEPLCNFLNQMMSIKSDVQVLQHSAEA